MALPTVTSMHLSRWEPGPLRRPLWLRAGRSSHGERGHAGRLPPAQLPGVPGPPGRWTGAVPGLLTSGLEGRSETTRLRGDSISQVWEPGVFPQKRLFSLCCAISAPSPARDGEVSSSGAFRASALGPAQAVLALQASGQATRVPSPGQGAQPQCSCEGQFPLPLCYRGVM